MPCSLWASSYFTRPCLARTPRSCSCELVSVSVCFLVGTWDSPLGLLGHFVSIFIVHVFCNIMGFPDLSFFNPDNALHQFRTGKCQSVQRVCCVLPCLQANALREYSHPGCLLRGHLRVHSIAGPMDRACDLLVPAVERHDDNPSDPRARYVLWVLIFSVDPNQKDEQQATNRAIAF